MHDELYFFSRSDIALVGGETPELYLEPVERAFIAQAQGRCIQPLKPYLRAPGGHVADRIIAMPAALLDEKPIAGIKWIGSRHDNPSRRGIERASGLIVLNDPETNYPIAILEAGLISGMRTAAVTAVAARTLARWRLRTLACIGCGMIGRLHLYTLISIFPWLEVVTLYDLDSAAAERLAAEIAPRLLNGRIVVATTAEAAVTNSEMIVTCTVAAEPYIPATWLRPGQFISNVSIMDLTPEAFLAADKVVVDDWEQANREKKVLHQLVEVGRFSRDDLYAELGEILAGRAMGREHADELIVFNPMGLGIVDIACAHAIYERARAQGIGLRLPR